MVLPGMAGKELGTKLLANNPNTKVLYLSGYTEEAIIHQGMLDAGAAFLQKPFMLQALARKVRDVLNTKPAYGLARRNRKSRCHPEAAPFTLSAHCPLCRPAETARGRGAKQPRAGSQPHRRCEDRTGPRGSALGVPLASRGVPLL